MKKLTLFLTTLAIANGLVAQPVTWTTELEGGTSGKLSEMTMEITGVGDDLIVKGYDGTEIIIETSDYEGIPEKAKGLKPLSASGEVNTNLGLHFSKSGDKFVLAGASRVANNSDYIVTIPNRMKLKVESMRWSGGDVKIEGMSGEVEARSNIGDIVLTNVSGPLVIWTLSSDIIISYDELSQTGPHSISSTSGEIDITLPGSSKGTFDMKSMSGEIYSDLDMEIPKKDEMQHIAGGLRAKGTMNGGGVDFDINSISGDVFMRKAK
jgi:lia operon protein LiaG